MCLCVCQNCIFMYRFTQPGAILETLEIVKEEYKYLVSFFLFFAQIWTAVAWFSPPALPSASKESSLAWSHGRSHTVPQRTCVVEPHRHLALTAAWPHVWCVSGLLVVRDQHCHYVAWQVHLTWSADNKSSARTQTVWDISAPVYMKTASFRYCVCVPCVFVFLGVGEGL